MMGIIKMNDNQFQKMLFTALGHLSKIREVKMTNHEKQDPEKFTITTSKKVADAIKKTFEFEEYLRWYRTCQLGEISHHIGFSVVEIKARNGAKINPEDIFFIGLFSANRADIE